MLNFDLADLSIPFLATSPGMYGQGRNLEDEKPSEFGVV